MTITLLTPSTGIRLGPGMLVEPRTSTSGPYPVDDYWVADLNDDATGQLLARGTNVNIFSGNTGVITLGVIDTPLVGLPQPLVNGAADGAAATLTCVYKHHSGAVVDGPTAFSGMHWDAVSGLFFILHSAAGGSLTEILNAVRRVHTTSGQ
jgi:hypothetical protein